MEAFLDAVSNNTNFLACPLQGWSIALADLFEFFLLPTFSWKLIYGWVWEGDREGLLVKICLLVHFSLTFVSGHGSSQTFIKVSINLLKPFTTISS